jgi:hypothetical protein
VATAGLSTACAVNSFNKGTCVFAVLTASIANIGNTDIINIIDIIHYSIEQLRWNGLVGAQGNHALPERGRSQLGMSWYGTTTIPERVYGKKGNTEHVVIWAAVINCD